MIPSETLKAAFTVPNVFQRLTATCPVQVYTYLFDTQAFMTAPSLLPSDQTCGTVYEFPSVRELAPHDHEHHEIAVIVGGRAVHRTAAYVSELGPGSALAIAPGEVHGFESIDGLRMINCAYLTEWLFADLRDMLSVDGLAPLFFPSALSSAGYRLRVPQWQIDQALLAGCVRELHDIGQERSLAAPSQMLMKRTLEKLMLLLHRTFVSSSSADLMPLRPRIRVALERIEECILQCEAFDVVSLAREMHMSRDRFGRLFREGTGWSPTDYYQHRRVQQASCLLLNKNQTITEVAYALGYYDAAHFSRLFKRYRGLSPREFRHKYAVEASEDN
ncbi:MAG: helix-turn-helix domain-containing protein [Phycisphaerae bacterium]|nr:helix-turn-helix domain-containing protein [Phycisphaerae bacterium]